MIDLKELQKQIKTKHPEWPEDKAMFIAKRIMAV